MKIPTKRIAFAAVLGAALLLAFLALRPSPVLVETARAVRGPLRVTVDEDGETRIHDRYVLAAPVDGHLRRIELHPGDPVKAGQVVALLDPLPLDARGREQAQARLRSSEAARREAEARARTERTALEDAGRTRARLEKLAREGVVPAEELDRARADERGHASELAAARFRAEAAGFEVESARAALIESGAAGAPVIPLRSPVDGRLLKICQQCDRVVTAGAELLEVGDPGKLEVVVDVLSGDAVKIRPGAPMLLTAGGDTSGALRGRVRLVEPAGFTKVSPLGVEEQRVNVVGDLLDRPATLGDRYRVDARIVLWEGRDVLKVPSGAIFRQGDGWALFAVAGDRARLRRVQVGHRNPEEAEILAGLRAGETVVVHPGDRIAGGAQVTAERK
jgi:HlyD family secretion protein